jgi:hypothetical protein
MKRTLQHTENKRYGDYTNFRLFFRGLLLVSMLIMSACGQPLNLPTQQPIDPSTSRRGLNPGGFQPLNPIEQLEEKPVQDAPQTISGQAVVIGTAVPTLIPAPPSPPSRDSEGDITLHEQQVAGGKVFFAIAKLGQTVKVRNIQAGGFIPSSDGAGDTTWTDGGKHLQPVEQIASLESSQFNGRQPVFSMAFGYHGAERTSDEGTVRTDGVTFRTNPGRGVICVSNNQNRAAIGLFTDQQLSECDFAAGAGPIFLVDGQIAGKEIKLNPLNEDFVQWGWRRDMYQNSLPKTMICIIKDQHNDKLVLMNSYGVMGVDLAVYLRDTLGCSYGIQGDDDGSTQAIWKGSNLFPRAVNAVPSAVSLYSLK